MTWFVNLLLVAGLYAVGNKKCWQVEE